MQGRVKQLDDVTGKGRTRLVVTVGDDSGDLRVEFRRGGADITPGQLVQITGKARRSGNRPVYMTDPSYQVVEEPQATTSAGG